MASVPGQVTAIRPVSTRDPSLPSSLPTTSYPPDEINELEEPKGGCLNYLYNKEKKEYCGRTCKSWFYMVCYAIMYLIFLSTYTLIFLYLSLFFIKHMVDFKAIDKIELLSYTENGIGLTAVPTSVSNFPMISYKMGKKEDYNKYVKSIDKFLSSRRGRRELTSLGPCGRAPYGYDERPCVLIKINKQLHWLGMPIQENSTALKSAPPEVLKWIKLDKEKLWLHCDGYYDYDKEHIRKIKYYPDPPGFDWKAITIDESPLVAVQLLDFTLGISLAIECKLWYDTGPSKIDFLLYIIPKNSTNIV